MRHARRRKRLPAALTTALATVVMTGASAAAAGLIVEPPATGATAVTSPAAHSAAAARDSVDEIHAAFGNNPGHSMWIYWHGSASRVQFGRTTAYGHSAKAHRSPVTQVDISGPIERAHLRHLTPGVTYHYRIDKGVDHRFRTAPTGKIHWDDIGDTGSTLDTRNPRTGSGCTKPWMADVWRGVRADKPTFITHGGDISYANECGVGSIHRFYNDIAPVATRMAWEQVWGNHEYGLPSDNPPPGTPRDSMANYKSRNYLANPQTVPTDTGAQVANPGCPSATNPGANGCLGQDWGWFVAGHVLVISEPEPWVNAQTNWGPRADALMAAAQADPSIYYIVTTGHRPAYTSTTSQADSPLRTVIDGLGDKYSPAARPDGKYVLNLAHHVHGGEIFAPQHGVVHVTNGGGGTDQAPLGPTVQPGSVFRTAHFEHLRIGVTQTALTVDMICGPAYPAAPTRNPCVTGSIIATTTMML